MAMQAKDIEALIKEAFPDAAVQITDLAGDGDHYAATVVSSAFKGKTRVQQHQMVSQHRVPSSSLLKFFSLSFPFLHL